MAEREPQPGMRPGLEEAWWNAERSWAIESAVDQPNAAGDPSLDRLPEQRDGLLEVANGKMSLGQAIAGFDLQAGLAELAGDVEGLLTRGQRAAMIADVAEPRSHVGEDQSQATSVAELAGDDLGVAHVFEDPVVLTQRRQNESRIETEVDGLRLDLATRRELGKRAQGGFQRAERLVVRGARRLAM